MPRGELIFLEHDLNKVISSSGRKKLVYPMLPEGRKNIPRNDCIRKPGNGALIQGDQKSMEDLDRVYRIFSSPQKNAVGNWVKL